MMRLSNLFQSKKSPKKKTSYHESKRRTARFETLERRELLALSTTTADYQALVAASSLSDSEDSAVWVTSLDDVTNANDGKITLREALDYATQKLSTGETVASKIRFTVGGTITLSSSSQSLKVLSKSIDIDASDVGGVTIKGQSSLLFYVFGGTASSPVSVSLTNLTLSNGRTTSANAKGTAIQLSPNCNLTATNCSIENNSSTSGLGTGIYVGSGSLTLIDSSVAGNVSQGVSSHGGAIYVDNGVFTAINTLFSDNQAGIGGAIYAKSSMVTLTGCTFRDNASSGDGGAVYATATTLTINESGFASNTSAENGGAVFVDGEEEASIVDTRFVENKAVNGGAIYQDTESLFLQNSSFTGNQVVQNGGALYMSSNTGAQLESNTFDQNKALVNGGAIFSSGSLFITSGEFSVNDAQKNGGAIYSTYYYEIRDVDFDENNSVNYGGAIYNKNEISSWILRSNFTSSSSLEGAAIYSDGKLSVVDSSFSQNTADNNGGAIVNLGTMFIGQSSITSNRALGLNGAGGGILNYPNASLNISNSILSANEVSDGSGGALANNGVAHLDQVTIDSNIADEFGGGVYNGGTLSVLYSTLSDNTANNGGALAITYGGGVSVNGSVLWGNKANQNGGAFYSYGSVSFKSSEISYNSASTAAVAAYYSPTDASNLPDFDSDSVISNNVAASSVHKNENTDVLLLDAQTFEQIDNNIYFGGVATLDNAVEKTLLLKNTGTTTLKFSNFSTIINDETSTFEISSTTSLNEKLNLTSSFILAPNDSIILTVKSTPGKLGAKVAELSWKTTQLSDEGVELSKTTEYFSVKSIINVAKSASTTQNVEEISTKTNANISFNEDGSFMIALSKAPTENVVVYLKAPDSVKLSTDVLLFTPTNYNTPQRVEVSLELEYFRNSDVINKEIVIQPQFVSGNSQWNGATCSRLVLKIENYIKFIGDNSVNLNQYASSGTTYWDLNGDGNTDKISQGESVWINASDISTDKIVSTQTSNGVTTQKEHDAPILATLPTAQGELEIFDTIPGMVRLSLESMGDIVNCWRIDWGDGSALTVSNEMSLSQVFSHCYAKDGNYQISVELIGKNNVGTGLWSTINSVSIENIQTTSSAVLGIATDSRTLEDHDLEGEIENGPFIPFDLIAQNLVDNDRSKRLLG